MVRFTDNKIIIELEVNSPAEDLQILQREIIEAIKRYDYQNFGSNNGCLLYFLLDLLHYTLPTYRQQRHIAKFLKVDNDPHMNQANILQWFADQKKFIQEDNGE